MSTCMLIGLSFGKHGIKNITITTININSLIFKIRFVTLKGVCMHFTCNENFFYFSLFNCLIKQYRSECSANLCLITGK